MLRLGNWIFPSKIFSWCVLLYLLLFDDDVPRRRNIAIPVALYRFSLIFLDRFVFGDDFFIVDVPSSVEISYFMVILFYCYCSHGRLINQGTNLGQVALPE